MGKNYDSNLVLMNSDLVFKLEQMGFDGQFKCMKFL